MLALFADATPLEQWAGPLGTSLLSFGTAFLAYLGTRDKLRYDVRMATLEADQKRLSEENAKLHDQHAECESKHSELQAELATVKARLDLLSSGSP